MAIQVCNLEEAPWRIVAPVLECMSVCRAFPPSATMIKSILAGTWKPTGVWLQRANIIHQIQEARATMARLCQASGLGRYHDAVLSEVLDALVQGEYVARVEVASSNEKHYMPTYRVRSLQPYTDPSHRNPPPTSPHTSTGPASRTDLRSYTTPSDANLKTHLDYCVGTSSTSLRRKVNVHVGYNTSTYRCSDACGRSRKHRKWAQPLTSAQRLRRRLVRIAYSIPPLSHGRPQRNGNSAAASQASKVVSPPGSRHTSAGLQAKRSRRSQGMRALNQ